ncbi:MAG: hypothetical protein HC858_10130 [Brachymonas sp.]|nr:hypothetical protein [Brachymonas sp.]
MPMIDHIARVEVDEATGLNELTTLASLAIGLNVLAQQVHLLEEPLILDEQERRKKVTFFGFGLLHPDQERLIPCLFHWFGTSVCNYARLVGFLSGLTSGAYTRQQAQDPKFYSLVRKHCSDYVDSVPELEPIKVWRNKVFAHFAITDPRKDDNAALLDASVMSPIAYFDSRLRVGGMTISLNGSGADLPHWSVTESYEALCSRYWP